VWRGGEVRCNWGEEKGNVEGFPKKGSQKEGKSTEVSELLPRGKNSLSLSLGKSL